MCISTMGIMAIIIMSMTVTATIIITMPMIIMGTSTIPGRGSEW